MHARHKNINDENKIYEFSKYISNDYVIELQIEKHFFHDFIYSLFKSELKNFKIYFDKHFVNNFINFFQTFINAFILFVQKKR